MVFWFVFVFVLCAYPGNYIPEVAFLNKLSFDKIIHLIIFFGLNHLSIRSLFYNNQFSIVFSLLISELVILYGITLEYMQTVFFINRFGEWIDVLANTTGTILAAYFSIKIYNK